MTIGLSSSKCSSGEEVDGEGKEGKSRSRKGEASQRECAMDDMEMVMKRLRT